MRSYIPYGDWPNQKKEVVVVTQAIMTETTQCTQRPSESLRSLAVARITDEAKCDVPTAERTLGWIQSFVERSRNAEYATQYPNMAEMDGDEYFVFDAVIPHGKVSAPGSAHEAIEAALLDPARNEFAIIHDLTDGVGYCTVRIETCTPR